MYSKRIEKYRSQLMEKYGNYTDIVSKDYLTELLDPERKDRWERTKRMLTQLNARRNVKTLAEKLHELNGKLESAIAKNQHDTIERILTEYNKLN